MKIENNVLVEVTEEDIEKGKLYIPEGVTTIEGNIFRGFENLREIFLPKSIREIKDDGFGNAYNLEYVHGMENVTTLGIYAFSCCRSLKEITIPNGIEILPKGTFYNCAELKTVRIPSSVKEIGPRAFIRCKSLCEITIPKSVTEIGIGCFDETLQLPKIKYEAGLDDNVVSYLKDNYKKKIVPENSILDSLLGKIGSIGK